VIQCQPLAAGQPEVAGDRLFGKNERPHGYAPADVEQSRVASLVRAQVVAREPHTACAAVVMHGEVGKFLVATGQDPIADEMWLEPSIAAGPWDVVNPVLCEEHVARQQPQSARPPRDPRGHDGAMLVVISREQVSEEPGPNGLREGDRPSTHGRLRSHVRIFMSFSAAVSRAGSRLLLAREIWIASRPSNVACDMASPIGSAPSVRVRSRRTKCG
jgi:hypothetical protein